MLKQIGKKIALFFLVLISWLGLFSWEILAFEKTQFNLAYIFGIFMGVCFSINKRLLKWKSDPKFQSEKLLWPFVLSILIHIPIVLFVILPKLGSRGWYADAFIGFILSGFLLTNLSTTAIAKDWERIQNI